LDPIQALKFLINKKIPLIASYLQRIFNFYLPVKIKNLTLQTDQQKWKFSSAGSEHLPYKQRVGGSNPSTSTSSPEEIRDFFLPYGIYTPNGEGNIYSSPNNFEKLKNHSKV
jgi:hypothetical protein